MNLSKPPLSYYVDLLNQGQPFALSRYGDGEWAWILDLPHINEEGHGYFPEMADDLRTGLKRNRPYPFHYAMPPLGNCHNQEMIAASLECIPEVKWYNCLTIARASLAGELYPLVEVLRRKRMIYLGPSHIFPFVHNQLYILEYRIIPGSNAYTIKSKALEILRPMIAALSPDVIGFSAGPLANILIDELWDGSTTLIDFGSIWDPYVGVNSRKYMQQDLSEELRKNLAEQ